MPFSLEAASLNFSSTGIVGLGELVDQAWKNGEQIATGEL